MSFPVETGRSPYIGLLKMRSLSLHIPSEETLTPTAPPLHSQTRQRFGGIKVLKLGERRREMILIFSNL